MTEPVVSSGSCPAWIARVSKSTREAYRRRLLLERPRWRALGALEPDDAEQLRERLVDRLVERARGADARLPVEALEAEDALGAVGLQVAAADDPVPPQERQHVVAVHALVRALVDLDHVLEAEEAAQERAVPDEVVERAEEDG